MQLRQVNIWREEQAGKGPGSEMRVGDVRALLPGLIEQYASQAQVVYLDPPFRTGQVFSMRARVGERSGKAARARWCRLSTATIWSAARIWR